MNRSKVSTLSATRHGRSLLDAGELREGPLGGVAEVLPSVGQVWGVGRQDAGRRPPLEGAAVRFSLLRHPRQPEPREERGGSRGAPKPNFFFFLLSLGGVCQLRSSTFRATQPWPPLRGAVARARAGRAGRAPGATPPPAWDARARRWAGQMGPSSLSSAARRGVRSTPARAHTHTARTHPAAGGRAGPGRAPAARLGWRGTAQGNPGSRLRAAARWARSSGWGRVYFCLKLLPRQLTA